MSNNNYEAALKAEMKKVTRVFQRYTPRQRATLAASTCNVGHRKRLAVGEYFYTHPLIPNTAFEKRKQAAEAALEVQS